MNFNEWMNEWNDWCASGGGISGQQQTRTTQVDLHSQINHTAHIADAASFSLPSLFSLSLVKLRTLQKRWLDKEQSHRISRRCTPRPLTYLLSLSFILLFCLCFAICALFFCVLLTRIGVNCASSLWAYGRRSPLAKNASWNLIGANQPTLNKHTLHAAWNGRTHQRKRKPPAATVVIVNMRASVWAVTWTHWKQANDDLIQSTYLCISAVYE